MSHPINTTSSSNQNSALHAIIDAQDLRNAKGGPSEDYVKYPLALINNTKQTSGLPWTNIQVETYKK